ncbi:MAG: NAD(P)(+) transhydrogenase (Re/Si-specific) subunit beta [Limisphaerales bacterium]
MTAKRFGRTAGRLNYTLIAVAIVIGLIIGAAGAYSVKMTAMPQMVALFNGRGRRRGGACREHGIFQTLAKF